MGLILGLDEAGRGALAGPLVVAGVLMEDKFKFENLNLSFKIKDSKQMSKARREMAYEIIQKCCLQVSYAVLTVEEINNNGINWANIEGFRRIIKHTEADCYIIDGRWKMELPDNKSLKTKCMVGADQNVPAVMSAGIAAKVLRDKIMKRLHCLYPEYGWDTNTGHGTHKHLIALREYGLSEYHRTKFVYTALKATLGIS